MDECTNHIFALSFVASFVSPFVAFALEAVFQHESKGTNGENSLIRINVYEHVNVCTHMKTVHSTIHSHGDRGIQTFVQVAR